MTDEEQAKAARRREALTKELIKQRQRLREDQEDMAQMKKRTHQLKVRWLVLFLLMLAVLLLMLVYLAGRDTYNDINETEYNCESQQYISAVDY